MCLCVLLLLWALLSAYCQGLRWATADPGALAPLLLRLPQLLLLRVPTQHTQTHHPRITPRHPSPAADHANGTAGGCRVLL